MDKSDGAGVVIVGTGLAGYGAAREYRKWDPSGPLTLITSGDGAFYSKPMLSAAWSAGRTPDQLAAKSAAAMATELNARIRTGETVTAADAGIRTLTLANGETVPFDKLVLAVGARPRKLAVPIEPGVPVHPVNDLDGYRKLRAGLPPGGRLLIIGAGLIGCEFAHDFAVAGHRVALLGQSPLPLPGLLPPALAKALRSALEALGVDFVDGDPLHSLMREGSGLRARLASGRELEADSALSAIGFDPELGLARMLGLEIGKGISVDTGLRTSRAGIYALGDCAEMSGRWLPFVQPLNLAARVLGPILAGREAALSLPPMPVLVKTPSYPVAVLPPPAGSRGAWSEESEPGGVRSLFRDGDGRILGFAAGGSHYASRTDLLKSVVEPIGTGEKTAAR
jgi:rubredoxin-NAD+ reductase